MRLVNQEGLLLHVCFAFKAGFSNFGLVHILRRLAPVFQGVN